MKPRLTRLVITAVVAACVAVPAAAAGTSGLVQIDGKLVAPNDVSATQLSAGGTDSSRLVQIGGALVRPSNVSSYQSRAAAPSIDGGSSSSSDDSNTLLIALIATAGALGVALVVGSSAVRRKGLATT